MKFFQASSLDQEHSPVVLPNVADLVTTLSNVLHTSFDLPWEVLDFVLVGFIHEARSRGQAYAA